MSENKTNISVTTTTHESETDATTTTIEDALEDEQSWIFDEDINVVTGTICERNRTVTYNMHILNSADELNVYRVQFAPEQVDQCINYLASDDEAAVSIIAAWQDAESNAWMFYRGYNMTETGVASLEILQSVCDSIAYTDISDIENIESVIDLVHFDTIYPYAATQILPYDENCLVNFYNYETGENLDYPVNYFTLRTSCDDIPILCLDLGDLTLAWNSDIKGQVFYEVPVVLTDNDVCLQVSVIDNMQIVDTEISDMEPVPVEECMSEIQRLILSKGRHDWYVYAAELCYVPIMEVERYYVTPIYDDNGDNIFHMVPVWAVYLQTVDEGNDVSNFSSIILINAITGEGMEDYAD